MKLKIFVELRFITHYYHLNNGEDSKTNHMRLTYIIVNPKK